MQVSFPNAFGGALPSAGEVRALQSQHGFSDGYAAFLLQQNGFNTNRLDEEPEAAKACLSEGGGDPSGCSDLAWLFQLNADADYLDLAPELAANLFDGVCFPLGASCGGNPYVEVLAGRWQGFIVSLDHELFASSESLQAFADNMDMGLAVSALTRDELADALCDPALGLAWFHASDIEQFLRECVCCDEQRGCFVRDAQDMPN